MKPKNKKVVKKDTYDTLIKKHMELVRYHASMVATVKELKRASKKNNDKK